MEYPLKGRDLERWERVRAAYQRLIDADDEDVCVCWHYMALDYGLPHVLPMEWLDEWLDECDEDGLAAPARDGGFDEAAPFLYEADGALRSARHLRDTPMDAEVLAEVALQDGEPFEIPEIGALLAD